MRKEPRSGICSAFAGFPVPFQGLCSHPCRTSQQYRYPFLAATFLQYGRPLFGGCGTFMTSFKSSNIAERLV